MNNRLDYVAGLRRLYPIGAKVRLIAMDDPWTHLEAGTIGEVMHIDDIGTIHVNWSTGSTLGLIPGEDRFELIREEKEHD